MNLMLLPLSLSEASGTFVGLEAQALIRGILGPAPLLVILSGCSYLVLRYVRRTASLVDLGVYLFASLLTLALTWPTTSSVSPAQVQAQAALGEEISSAQQLLPGREAVQIPRIEVDVLTAITSMWVNVALAINNEGDRPFSEVAPISWLLQQRLHADTTARIRDWTTVCIMPARITLLQAGAGGSLGHEDLLPFPGSLLHTTMSGMTRQIGESEENCGAVASEVLGAVTDEVAAFLSPAGTSMSEIWSEEFNFSPESIVRELVLREVTRTSGPAIQLTSLPGIYLGVQAIRANAGGLLSAIGGALSLNPARLLGGIARVLGQGTVDTVQDATAAVHALVSKALFVSKFSADIVGVLQGVILAVFPFVVLVALAPGAHVKVLVSYLYLLVAAYSMPFAWTLVDVMADIAFSRATIDGFVSDPVGTLEALAAGLIIITVGTWVALLGLAVAILLPIGGAAVGVLRVARGG